MRVLITTKSEWEEFYYKTLNHPGPAIRDDSDFERARQKRDPWEREPEKYPCVVVYIFIGGSICPHVYDFVYPADFEEKRSAKQ